MQTCNKRKVTHNLNRKPRRCVCLRVCVLCVFDLARARAMRMRDKKGMPRVDGDKLTCNCRLFPRTQELLRQGFRSLRRAPRSIRSCQTGRAETVDGRQHRGTGRQSERRSEARGLRVAHASRCPLARVSGGGDGWRGGI
jgi:hypothetical protein